MRNLGVSGGTITAITAGRLSRRRVVKMRKGSTYDEPAKYSEGIKYVVISGVMIIKDGQLQKDVYPGRAVRAPY